MISYPLNRETIESERQVGSKAYNLARVAGLIGQDAIAKGFVIPADSIRGQNLKAIAQEIYLECLKYNVKLPIILRSSANVEDSEYSFAGIFESYTCVDEGEIYSGLRDMLLLIKSHRLQLYCEMVGIDRDKVELSIIVQTFIDADYAGVAFSKHPITNDEQVIYIEYFEKSIGDVEKGNGNPNRAFINKDENIYVSTHEDEMFFILRKYIVWIEEFFEHPIDVEWAYTRGKLLIFQVRQITT